MCVMCGVFVLLESHTDIRVCGLHEGAAAGGWTCVSVVSRVSGCVSPGCCVKHVGEGTVQLL